VHRFWSVRVIRIVVATLALDRLLGRLGGRTNHGKAPCSGHNLNRAVTTRPATIRPARPATHFGFLGQALNWSNTQQAPLRDAIQVWLDTAPEPSAPTRPTG